MDAQGRARFIALTDKILKANCDALPRVSSIDERVTQLPTLWRVSLQPIESPAVAELAPNEPQIAVPAHHDACLGDASYDGHKHIFPALLRIERAADLRRARVSRAFVAMRTLDSRDRLSPVAKRFAGIDLSPENVSNADMGDLFENLIYRFAESANTGAGQFSRPATS